jgi:hypothetical protein
MNDRRKSDRPRSKIEDFETLEVLYSDQVLAETASIGIVVEVQRPVFEGGRTGGPRLSCVITRASRGGESKRERVFRIPCIRGDTAEVEALFSLLQRLADRGPTNSKTKLDECQHKFDQRVERTSKRRDNGDAKPGQVGGGLSRFSGESKRDKKRRKRQRARQQDG